MKNRVTTLALALMMCLSLAPMTALAAEPKLAANTTITNFAVPGLSVTLTNVYDKYYKIPNNITVYLDSSGTVCFDKDIPASIFLTDDMGAFKGMSDITVEAGKIYSAKDLENWKFSITDNKMLHYNEAMEAAEKAGGFPTVLVFAARAKEQMSFYFNDMTNDISELAASAQAGGTLKNPQTVTVSIPEAPGVTFKIENVYDEYVRYGFTNANYDWREIPAYVFFYNVTSAITCNKVTSFMVGEGYYDSEIEEFLGGYYMSEDFAANHRLTVGTRVFDLSLTIVEGGVPMTNYGNDSPQTVAVIYFKPLSEPTVPEQYKDYPPRPVSELSSAVPPAPALTAKPTASMVLVNGKAVAFDAYNINGNNYFKLRDLAYTLSGTAKQFEVTWDGAKNAVSLTGGKAYTTTGGEMTAKGAGSKTPVPTSSKIYLNGKEVSLTAYNIDGNNYFKLRDIGQAFDFGVTWDGAKNTIVIDTSTGYTPE